MAWGWLLLGGWRSRGLVRFRDSGSGVKSDIEVWYGDMEV